MCLLHSPICIHNQVVQPWFRFFHFSTTKFKNRKVVSFVATMYTSEDHPFLEEFKLLAVARASVIMNAPKRNCSDFALRGNLMQSCSLKAVIIYKSKVYLMDLKSFLTGIKVVIQCCMSLYCILQWFVCVCCQHSILWSRVCSIHVTFLQHWAPWELPKTTQHSKHIPRIFILGIIQLTFHAIDKTLQWVLRISVSRTSPLLGLRDEMWRLVP